MRRCLAGFRPLRRPLSTFASPPAADAAPVNLWRDVYNVDASRCSDPLVCESDLRVMLDVITEDEERVVADECMKILRRRRYEENHWDSVIIKFKEMERSRWSTETKRVLDKLRELPLLPQGLDYFPAVHVIELAEDGYIKAHVDNIKFSGRVVAGLNLLSPSIMRFNEEHGDSVLEAYLPRRSMYMMTGRVRFHYAHEILPGAQVFKGELPVHRTHRISVMMRDEFRQEHVDKYHTPFAKADPEEAAASSANANGNTSTSSVAQTETDPIAMAKFLDEHIMRPDEGGSYPSTQ